MVQQNPQLLEQILPLLAQSNPELMQQIMQNREGLMQMLGGAAGGGPGAGAPQQVLQLTPQEMEAIERLQQLGFPREAVAQAYIACDKNEEIAANYLFEHGDDLMG